MSEDIKKGETQQPISDEELDEAAGGFGITRLPYDPSKKSRAERLPYQPGKKKSGPTLL